MKSDPNTKYNCKKLFELILYTLLCILIYLVCNKRKRYDNFKEDIK